MDLFVYCISIGKVLKTFRDNECFIPTILTTSQKLSTGVDVCNLSQSSKGWTKELNLISWNYKEPKYDLREWDPAHEKMGKGVTLSADEFL